MKKTKKGFTLIEVVVGMLILGFALVVGAQTFAAVGTGYTRAALLDHGADNVFNTFEQGAATLPAGITKKAEPINIKIKIGDKTFENGTELVTVKYTDQVNSVTTSLYGLSNTYGKSK